MAILVMDEFEDALLGYISRPAQEPFAVYSETKVVDILVKDGLSPDEAREHIDFNVNGGWVGPSTPGLLIRTTPDELGEFSDNMS